MRKKITLLFSLSLLILTSSYADNKKIVVPVHLDFTPVSATGVLIDKNISSLIKNPKVRAQKNGYYSITFSYDPEKFSDKLMASAIIEGQNKETAVANVRLANKPSSEELLLSLPVCAKVDPPASLGDRISLIENLVRVRSEFKSNSKEKLKNIMNKETLEKLEKLEKGFGHNPKTSLSANLSPWELVERLSRIANSVKKYRTLKN